VRGEAVGQPGELADDERRERGVRRPVGVDVLEAARLDLAREERGARHDHEGLGEELERAAVPAECAGPGAEVRAGATNEPVELRREDLPREAAVVPRARDELVRAGVAGPRGGAEEREDVELEALAPELEHLVQDEGLGRRREPGHQVRDAASTSARRIGCDVLHRRCAPLRRAGPLRRSRAYTSRNRSATW
jgi:hypothetical protein